MGCSILLLHQVGGGCPDLLIGRAGKRGRVNLLVEVKDGSRPPSERVLTPEQIRFRREWRGQVAVVSTMDELIALLQ